MTRLIAVFAGLLYCIVISSCTVRELHTDESAASFTESIASGGSSAAATHRETEGTSAASQIHSGKQASAASTASGADVPAEPTSIGIAIHPDKEGECIVITYPDCEINQLGTGTKSGSYTLYLTPGDYTDPDNAITTFLFDLARKQSNCFYNIHTRIKSEPQIRPFLQTLYLLESLMLSLGQIDALMLPRIDYDETGIPFLCSAAAAYKARDENAIRFGFQFENEICRQSATGVFTAEEKSIRYKVLTEKDGLVHTILFEAVRLGSEDYIYRCVDNDGSLMRSVFVTVSDDELMQAGYSTGDPAGWAQLTPLNKESTLSRSGEEIGLTQRFYLFANADGARITPVEKQ